jgi:uncharacterized protein DUF3352
MTGIEQAILSGDPKHPVRPRGSRSRQSMGSTARRAGTGVKPRFMLAVALRDPARFESLIAQLFAKASKGTSQAMARLQYRGATIVHNGSVAYTVSGGFFVLSGSPGDIKRALDANATGNSLASSADFRSAIGAPQPAMMQAYLSSAISRSLFEAIVGDTAKSSPGLAAPAGTIAMQSPIGLTVTPDTEGAMIETKLPTELALLALSSLAAHKPSPYGVGDSPDSGVRPGQYGRKVPKLTTDDVRRRQP